MKCTIPEISWHNRDPVLSVDVQPVLNNEFYRLASGGTDSHVLIWHLKILDTGATSVEAVCDLTRHQRAVNVVRWSPTGQYLASGDDDSNIIVWQQKADGLIEMIDGETQDKEKWSVFKILRGHKEDVYDISWSPNSLKLISGSVDNTAIVWDLNKGINDNILTDHKGFVQGVCWDPQGDFLATLSSDRICRIFNETGKQVKCRMSKGILNLPESHPLHGQVVRYYHDDTLKSFFRRLAFTPDGNLLVTPAGCLDIGNNKNLYTTYIYSVNSFSQPVAILPSPGQYTIAVRCCPILFELRPDAPEPAISLPYRMVIAVATRSSVILYDTQQLTPFAVISNIHYTRLTDLTWSQDGLILAVSSTDGFCSLVTFEPNELGTEYIKEEKEKESDIESIIEEEEKIVEIIEEKIEIKKEEKKRPSFLMQWAKKSIDNKVEKDNIMKEKDTNIIVIMDSPEKDNTDKTLPNLNEIKKKLDISDVPKPIAVRRKPKNVETKSPITTPAKPIEVRRKPKEVEKINGHSNIEKNTLPDTQVNNPSLIIKPIVVHKNMKDSLVSSPSTSTKSPKTIGIKKTKESDLNSPSTSTKLINSPSSTAKPIAVRRKPRDQMDITKFLTNEPPTKKLAIENKSRVSLFTNEKDNKDVIIIEDAIAQDAWTQKMETKEISKDFVMMDDSQDIRLIIEDSQKECSLDSFEKFHESQKENCDKTSNNSEVNDKIETTVINKNLTNEQVNIENDKTDDKVLVSQETKSVNDIKSKITELHLQSPVNKKKVPFITLSSPKNKKNKS